MENNNIKQDEKKPFVIKIEIREADERFSVETGIDTGDFEKLPFDVVIKACLVAADNFLTWKNKIVENEKSNLSLEQPEAPTS